MLPVPVKGEFPPYFERYISLVHHGDVLPALRASMYQSLLWMTTCSPEQWMYRYAEGKWSVKEVWSHIIDTERIFAYRALRIGRNDKTPLPGFDQDAFVAASNADHRSVASLIEEYEAVRKSSIVMFENFQADDWTRQGNASQNTLQLSAVPFIILGHELHHRQILNERYQFS